MAKFYSLLLVMIWTMSARAQTRWITPDFFVQRLPKVQTSQFWTARLKEKPVSDCRAHIRQVMCWVEPVKEDSSQNALERTCLPGGEVYASVFEQLYDQYPPVLQKMFCSLDRIFIEKKFFGTAYAGYAQDENENNIGAIMGIRQSVLDEKLNLTTWATWKEQLSFGGIMDRYESTPGLPQIATQTALPVNDFLYFVVAHEFGHLFDFSNQVNELTNCDGDPDNIHTTCQFKSGTWGNLSWMNERKPWPEHDFPLRTSLCFYRCDNKYIESTNISTLYRDLSTSAFISTYAAVQAWDDFADSLAYYLLREKLQSRYMIDLHTGESYDSIQKLSLPVFERKQKYLQDFLSRKNLVYP